MIVSGAGSNRAMPIPMARIRRLVLLGFLTLLAATACDSGDAQPLVAEGGTWEQRWMAAQPLEAVIVLTVDDGVEAANLRAELGDALEATVFTLLDQTSHAPDPTSWRYVDWSIWITRPTAEGSDRWLDPLSLRTDQPSEADLSMLADAIEARLSALTPVLDGTYRPIETTRDAVTLLTGQRAPADTREKALLAQLTDDDGPLSRGRRAVEAVVISERDDEGTLSPAALALTPQSDPPWTHYAMSLVVPSELDECHDQVFPPDADMPRLRDWANASESFAGAVGWPCGRGLLEDRGLLATIQNSIGGADDCTSRPIRTQSDGTVLCRVWVEDLPEGTACADYGRGWIEPGPGAPLGADCEVPQLSGDARQSCRSAVDCEDCGSGFCRADTGLWDELYPAHACQGRTPSRLRFVGGAVAATLRVRCDLL